MRSRNLGFDPNLSRFVKRITCDAIGTVSPAYTMHRLDAHVSHMRLNFVLPESIRQDDWQLELEPAFTPTFHWAPHLTPTDQHIIDQHSFRSPALIAQDERQLLILIPDLDLMLEGSPVRWYMDLDASRQIIKLGMSEYQVSGHVLYERKEGAVYPQGEVKIGFYLMTFEEPEMLANPWRPVLSFLWEKWGSPLVRSGAPLPMSAARHVQHAYHWAFQSWKEAVWQQFELNGATVGACTFIVNVTQSPNYPGTVNEREMRSIWNQAWFSSLRSAQGVYRYGKEIGDESLIRKANMTKELALSAPQRSGFFPSVIATEMEQIEVGGKLVNRSKGWETAHWGNSNRNPIQAWQSVKDAPYHVLDMSWTALLMLRWYESFDKDVRLLAYARSYAEALIELQDDRGFFPAWLDAHSLEPLDILSDSPETSLSATFLLKLAQLTGNETFASCALRAADAVVREIVPVGRWEDFETYWSCSSFGNKDHVGLKFSRNNMYKQCNFSMFWTAEALLACYEYTKEIRYLQLGERCLDEMLMTQASWQPPYIHVQALGGFGVMNCDGEWNDSRQSLFAELILAYGKELGREEYVERGIAALKCAFVMMYCPENPESMKQWEHAYPFFNERDYGFMMENYGHGGAVNDKGLGIGEFTIFDWGNGAAAEAYLRIKARYPELVSSYGL